MSLSARPEIEPIAGYWYQSDSDDDSYSSDRRRRYNGDSSERSRYSDDDDSVRDSYPDSDYYSEYDSDYYESDDSDARGGDTGVSGYEESCTIPERVTSIPLGSGKSYEREIDSVITDVWPKDALDAIANYGDGANSDELQVLKVFRIDEFFKAADVYKYGALAAKTNSESKKAAATPHIVPFYGSLFFTAAGRPTNATTETCPYFERALRGSPIDGLDEAREVMMEYIFGGTQGSLRDYLRELGTKDGAKGVFLPTQHKQYLTSDEARNVAFSIGQGLTAMQGVAGFRHCSLGLESVRVDMKRPGAADDYDGGPIVHRYDYDEREQQRYYVPIISMSDMATVNTDPRMLLQMMKRGILSVEFQIADAAKYGENRTVPTKSQVNQTQEFWLPRLKAGKRDKAAPVGFQEESDYIEERFITDPESFYPPELYFAKSVGAKTFEFSRTWSTDLWAYGCILLEIFVTGMKGEQNGIRAYPELADDRNKYYAPGVADGLDTLMDYNAMDVAGDNDYLPEDLHVESALREELDLVIDEVVAAARKTSVVGTSLDNMGFTNPIRLINSVLLYYYLNDEKAPFFKIGATQPIATAPVRSRMVLVGKGADPIVQDADVARVDVTQAKAAASAALPMFDNNADSWTPDIESNELYKILSDPAKFEILKRFDLLEGFDEMGQPKHLWKLVVAQIKKYHGPDAVDLLRRCLEFAPNWRSHNWPEENANRDTSDFQRVIVHPYFFKHVKQDAGPSTDGDFVQEVLGNDFLAKGLDPLDTKKGLSVDLYRWKVHLATRYPLPALIPYRRIGPSAADQYYRMAYNFSDIERNDFKPNKDVWNDPEAHERKKREKVKGRKTMFRLKEYKIFAQ